MEGGRKHTHTRVCLLPLNGKINVLLFYKCTNAESRREKREGEQARRVLYAD